MSAIRNSIVLSILFIILSLNLTTYSQSFTFPVDGKSVDDISSSFGPRNLGPTADDNYPDADYDYDFHCALDIAASQNTDVFAVWTGVVSAKGSDYLITGKEVKTLVNELKPAGYYSINWDGTNSDFRQAASGMYIYCMRTRDFIESKKMLLIR